MSNDTTIDIQSASDELVADIEAYLKRAANCPPPSTDLVQQIFELPLEMRALPATHTFFCDISEFQDVLTKAYPYPVLSIRLDTGWRTDYHAQANLRLALRWSQIKILICYVVCIPGQEQEAVTRVKKLFPRGVPNKVVFMVDMESGADFAGPGDHTASGNMLLSQLGRLANSGKKLIAYANGYDFANCWSGLDPAVKRITASYGGGDPGSWGWQYAGGDPKWSSPAGYPRQCPPFGAWVDFNVVNRTVAQMERDLGIRTPARKPPEHHHVVTYPTYRVRRGDTLTSIAHRHHTTWHQLVVWNKNRHPSLATHPNIIHIGWILRVGK